MDDYPEDDYDTDAEQERKAQEQDEHERTKVYEEALASGLSDYEAREEAWPTTESKHSKASEITFIPEVNRDILDTPRPRRQADTY